MNVSFIAIYRGETVQSARLIAVSADPTLVADVSSCMLDADQTGSDSDPIISELDRARRHALRLIQGESHDSILC
jgi:hypothetical protein